MARLLQTDRIEVNSLHSQGIDCLAPALEAEAIAPDGLIEAYSVKGAARFALAVQWHPEWRAWENPVSIKLFEAFGQDCRARMLARV
jgi:putative glutamine amidotransferase